MFWRKPWSLMPKVEDKTLCSKCGKNPRMSQESTNPWCNECHAEYVRENRKTVEWRTERRGIIRGVQAMREAIAAHFRQWGGRPFMGNEVASMVDSLPGPQVADENATKN